MVDLNQYALEMSWSARATDAIISESVQDDISMATEFSILEEIEKVNPRNVTNADIYIKFLSLILKEKAAKPIQAIATQLGHIAGFKNSAEAFEWGLSLVKIIVC